MNISKRAATNIPLESAHDGAGSRKLLATEENVLEAMTDGFLAKGGIFDWHNHENIEEVMYVLSGSGTVSDRDGEYEYTVGDFFTFPTGIEHKISANEDSRMIFVRSKI